MMKMDCQLPYPDAPALVLCAERVGWVWITGHCSMDLGSVGLVHPVDYIGLLTQLG